MILWKLDTVMRLRRVKGRELARRMNIGENYLSRVRHEAPERLSLSLLESLCRELGVGIADLLEYRPGPAPARPEPLRWEEPTEAEEAWSGEALEESPTGPVTDETSGEDTIDQELATAWALLDEAQAGLSQAEETAATGSITDGSLPLAPTSPVNTPDPSKRPIESMGNEAPASEAISGEEPVAPGQAPGLPETERPATSPAAYISRRALQARFKGAGRRPLLS